MHKFSHMRGQILSSNKRNLFFRLGSDPKKLYSCDLMMEHFRKFGKFGLILAAVRLPVITADKGQTMNLDEISDIGADYNLEDLPFFTAESKNRYAKRMRDVIIDMDRLGYFS